MSAAASRCPAAVPGGLGGGGNAEGDMLWTTRLLVD